MHPAHEDSGAAEAAQTAFGRALAGLGRAAQIVCGAMFVLVFAIFMYKIAARYLAHDEPAWTDEVSVVLFVWIIFWATSLIVRDRDQIVFDLVYRPLPDRAKRVFAIARLLLVGGIFAFALPGSLDYIAFLWRERTPVLGWRLDLVYSCFGLFMVAVIVRSVLGLVRLLRADWRKAL